MICSAGRKLLYGQRTKNAPFFCYCLSLIPKNSRSKPANIFGLFTTTTFITRSFQHLKRNIPNTISSTAITNSITFSEKNEMHIIAPKNAAAAKHSPAFERLCRRGLLRRNIPFTSFCRFRLHRTPRHRLCCIIFIFLKICYIFL